MHLSRPLPFAPHCALLHPVWLAALGTLALNDHVLKGAGFLPALVTGKLSDFAGLLVAPLLLAALARVRTEGGWLLAHIAVGLVFSAIQLSVPAADFWSASMGLLGFPWAITSDPSDLTALPMLALSHRWFPVLAGQASALGHARRSGQLAAAGTGLLCCMGTSPAPEPPGETSGWLWGDVYLHNPNDFDIVIRIRELTATAQISCDEVAADPARLLTDALFGSAQTWTLPPGLNQPLLDHEPGAQPCYAVLLEADNVAPAVVFWRDGEPQWGDIATPGLDPNAPGWISIEYDSDGTGRYDDELDLVYARSTETAENACVVSPATARLEWTTPLPTGLRRIRSITPGFDGCLALELGFAADGGRPLDPWYLCMPQALFPFAVGDDVELFSTSGGQTPDEPAASLTIVRHQSDEVEEPRTELVLTRGSLTSSLYDLQSRFMPDLECSPEPDSTCGTVQRSGRVVFSGTEFPAAELGQGETVTLQGYGGDELELHLALAAQTIAFDPSCDETRDVLGIDIEFVTVHRAAL